MINLFDLRVFEILRFKSYGYFRVRIRGIYGLFMPFDTLSLHFQGIIHYFGRSEIPAVPPTKNKHLHLVC